MILYSTLGKLWKNRKHAGKLSAGACVREKGFGGKKIFFIFGVS